MVAYTEVQRVSIRKYLGYPSLFQQFEPRLEHAITSTQAIADGGAMPDDSTQLSIISVLTKIENIEDKITALYCSMQVEEVGQEKVRLNMAMGLELLKSEGRRLIHQLAIPLGVRVVRDYFGYSELNDPDSNSPFITY